MLGSGLIPAWYTSLLKDLCILAFSGPYLTSWSISSSLTKGKSGKAAITSDDHSLPSATVSIPTLTQGTAG